MCPFSSYLQEMVLPPSTVTGRVLSLRMPSCVRLHTKIKRRPHQRISSLAIRPGAILSGAKVCCQNFVSCKFDSCHLHLAVMKVSRHPSQGSTTIVCGFSEEPQHLSWNTWATPMTSKWLLFVVPFGRLNLWIPPSFLPSIRPNGAKSKASECKSSWIIQGHLRGVQLTRSLQGTYSLYKFTGLSDDGNGEQDQDECSYPNLGVRLTWTMKCILSIWWRVGIGRCQIPSKVLPQPFWIGSLQEFQCSQV